MLSAYALAASEENARGHLVITAPTGGSAGVMPSLVYGLGEGGRKLPLQKLGVQTQRQRQIHILYTACDLTRRYLRTLYII